MHCDTAPVPVAPAVVEEPHLEALAILPLLPVEARVDGAGREQERGGDEGRGEPRGGGDLLQHAGGGEQQRRIDRDGDVGLDAQPCVAAAERQVPAQDAPGVFLFHQTRSLSSAPSRDGSAPCLDCQTPKSRSAKRTIRATSFRWWIRMPGVATPETLTPASRAASRTRSTCSRLHQARTSGRVS